MPSPCVTQPGAYVGGCPPVVTSTPAISVPPAKWVTAPEALPLTGSDVLTFALLGLTLVVSGLVLQWRRKQI